MIIAIFYPLNIWAVSDIFEQGGIRYKVDNFSLQMGERMHVVGAAYDFHSTVLHIPDRITCGIDSHFSFGEDWNSSYTWRVDAIAESALENSPFTEISHSCLLVGKKAFMNSKQLKEITMPDIFYCLSDSAFMGCEKLEKINFFRAEGIRAPKGFLYAPALGARVFAECKSLKYIDLTKLEGYGISRYFDVPGSTFENCTALKEIVIGGLVKYVGPYAFKGCKAITDIWIFTNPDDISDNAFDEEIYQNATVHIDEYWINSYSLNRFVHVVPIDSTEGLNEGESFTAKTAEGVAMEFVVKNKERRTCWIGKKRKDNGTAIDSLTEGTITIPDSINNYYVVGIEENAFKNCNKISEIVIPESIDSICSGAFSGCSGLGKISFEGEIKYLASNAFENIGTLEQPVMLEVPKKSYYNALLDKDGKLCGGYFMIVGILSNNIDFSDEKVKDICIAKWDTDGDGELSEAEAANIKSLGYAFGLSSITTFDELRYFTGLTTIDEHAFDRCPNLQLVTIPSQVTSIGRAAFSACGALTTVTLPEGLTTIEEMSFERCSGLKSITIPSKVTSIGRAAFSACSSLTSITLPEGLTSIPELCFERCSGLKSIYIPASVNSIGNNVFAQCNSLEEIVSDILDPYDIDASVFTNTTYASAKLIVPKGTQSKYRNALGWKNFSNIVESEPSDSPIIFADAEVKRICVENWDTNGDGELSEKEASVVIDLGRVFKGNSSIKQFDELRFFSSLESIGNNEFEDCYRLSSIVLPNAVKSIGAYAFSGCIFSTISIPSSVTEIHYSGLRNCSENIYVDTSNAYYSSLEGVLFSKDGKQLLTYPIHRSETSYIIPNIVSVIGECAFYSSGLKSVIIPNGVVSIKRAAFRYCSSLESIILPSSLTTIESENLEYCDKLTTITIPKSVTYLGSDVLSSCKGLQSIIVEDGNVNYSSIDGILYNKDKTKLQIYPAGKTEKEFVIPSHVTAIESYAFYGCQNLESITIHKDVTHIGRMAFMNCVELTSFTVKRAEPVSISADVFGKDILSYGILYVPYSSKAKYQVASGWKNFCNIVESEEEPAIVTAKSYSREYGEPNPEFDFISEGAEIFGTPSISCTATKTSPVGSYDITISKGSIENGKVTYVKGTLKITKAPLTIKAGEYTKYQGSENPEFKPTYEGFKNGETEDVLSKMPVVTTSANEDSPLGEYEVFITGAEAQNYEISYVAGTLIVEKLPKGDLDGKGYTDVSDVVATINHILGFRFVLTSEKEQIDMNDDGEINVGDVILLVKKILMQGNHFEIPTLARGDAETVDLTQYTAMQLTVNVPSGARIKDIRLTGDNNSSHSLMYQQTDAEHYTVVVYSMNNQTFKPVNGCLLEVDMEGNGEPMTTDVLLATPSGGRAFISTLPIGTATGITEMSINQLATGNVYDLRGNKVLDSGVSLKQLTKGAYIMNGKKIIR